MYNDSSLSGRKEHQYRSHHDWTAVLTGFESRYEKKSDSKQRKNDFFFHAGTEPMTFGLSDQHFTNWATRVFKIVILRKERPMQSWILGRIHW